MSHHLSSFFKSAAGVAENVWESAANNLSNSPKRNRELSLTVRQSLLQVQQGQQTQQGPQGQQGQQVQQVQQGQQVQPRRLFPAVRPAPVPATATPTAGQSIGLGLGLGMELGNHEHEHNHDQSSIPREVENQIPNTSSNSAATLHTTPTPTSTSTTPTTPLTKTLSKTTQKSATSKETTTSTTKSANSYNPLVTTSSTYTNPSENLPPTPNLKAVDEVGRFADVVAGGAGAGGIGGGEGSTESAAGSTSEEISPVDGLGMFGPRPGSGSAAASAGSIGVTAHERTEHPGSINMPTPTVTASGSRVHNYRGMDHGPVAIPGSGSRSGSGSGFTTPRLSAVGLGTQGGITHGRERAFTIPRKPVPMTIRAGDAGLEVVPYGRAIEDIGTGACIVNRQECMDWKDQFEGPGRVQGGEEGNNEGEGGEGEEEEVGESEEERKERLEKERKEREKMDL
ncbi:hypothetical protein BPOR_1249g00010 [Botrytis porri]|uniref:Uncharacterized protein n=1 Tax=Botrytis porri TaxID=87229 RepID=A0A4Z1K6G4_9HELO|nr:hypothetical protein BPOR_1249g00010 [Botrytis porri]